MSHCSFLWSGTLYNRDNREYLVKAFPVSIRLTKDRISSLVIFRCRSSDPRVSNLRAPVSRSMESNGMFGPCLLHEPANQLAVLSCHVPRHPLPDSRRRTWRSSIHARQKGRRSGRGSFVGTSFIFSHNADLERLKAIRRFFFDDSLTPQAQGTGPEEWGGGGDYWGGLNMTLPFVGHPVGAIVRSLP